MELYKINGYIATCQRNGNDRNGNSIYLINVFDSDGLNVNYKIDRKKDKYGNIRTMWGGRSDIVEMIQSIK